LSEVTAHYVEVDSNFQFRNTENVQQAHSGRPVGILGG